MPSLIGTVTGAPDRPFPTDSSEVVLLPPEYKTLSPSGSLSGNPDRKHVSSSLLFTPQLYHSFAPLSIPRTKGLRWRTLGRITIFFATEGRENQKKGYHNLKNG